MPYGIEPISFVNAAVLIDRASTINTINTMILYFNTIDFKNAINNKLKLLILELYISTMNTFKTINSINMIELLILFVLLLPLKLFILLIVN